MSRCGSGYNIFKSDENPLKVLGGDFNLTMTLNLNKYTCPTELRVAFKNENQFVGNEIDFLVIPIGSKINMD